MTGNELLTRVMEVLDPGVTAMSGIFRAGSLLLSLPQQREAADRALRLYQPQRPIARAMVTLLRAMVKLGQHRMILPGQRIYCDPVTVTPALSGIDCGTCGVMLGSPEHRVPRAIASYSNAGTWEVAKFSIGEAGKYNLEHEAQVLDKLHLLADGVPSLLGLHRSGDMTILRMPYLTGRAINEGESTAAIKLLDHWITNHAPRRMDEFPEWEAIESALSGSEAGAHALGKLAQETLRPVIRHGDFARWNLLHQEDDRLMVLDWEWGHEEGMPGLDLVHYFLQDARLVNRLSSEDAIRRTVTNLESSPCGEYLCKTGWSGTPLLTIIASLAFKQGAGHQENTEVLRAAVGRMH